MNLLEILSAGAPATIDAVVSTLEAIDAALPETDGLAWFNRFYLRVTRAVRDRIAAAEFANPAWMAKLDVVFAGYYCTALVEWERGGQPPGCWRALLSQRGECAIARIQFALAGVNAHINHDLPLALLDTFEATGVDPQQGGLPYTDYTSLNATLAAQIAAATAEWMVRLPGDALPEANRLADTLAAWSLTAAREAAWTNAELLWGIRDLPLVAGRYLDVIDGLASVAGKALLVPVP
jgi:hypothetical protein